MPGFDFFFFGNALLDVLSWVEGHSVIVGLITAAVVSSLWFRSFLRQRRAEAFFGFYARLMLQLSRLDTWLQAKGMLNVDHPENGNIYSYMYVADTRTKVCEAFHPLDDIEMKELCDFTSDLREILLQSENNVYPKRIKKQLWYDSQQVLVAFCDFVELDSMRGKTNEPLSDSKECKHVVKCRELITAIESIRSLIGSPPNQSV